MQRCAGPAWAWPWPWSSGAAGRRFDELDYGLPLRRAVLPEVELALHERGRGRRSFVLLHGLGSDLRVWSRNLEPLASRGRVIAIDLPGFGKSSKPDVDYALPWQARTIVTLLDQCGIDRAVVCGHSMGGQLALQLALDHPERVEGLVLAAPAGFERFSAREAQWIRGHVDEGYTARAGAATVTLRYLQTFHVMPRAAWPLLRDRLAILGGPDLPAYARAVCRAVAAMLAAPVLDRLAAITTPTWVSFGTHDALIPNRILHGRDTAALARRAVAALPDAALALVRDAGHMVQLERPEAWNVAALTWLARRMPA